MIKKEIVNLLSKVVPKETILVEQTVDKKFGDYATQLAMKLAKKQKKNPMEIAKTIVSKVPKIKFLEKVEIAPPGFINFFLSDKWLSEQVVDIINQDKNFGSSNIGKNKKVLVEFVSANPTGPLHIGNARGGPIGDVIANVLIKTGFKVTREFYINDVGNQVNLFGETLLFWYLKKKGKKVKFPENGYKGDYVKEIASEIKKPEKESASYFAHIGIKKIIKQIINDCKGMGISFDHFTYESEILKNGGTKSLILSLKKQGLTQEKEGALWFYEKGQENQLKDREYVLIRSDAEKTPTYFANDLAYHIDKHKRGFDKAIDVLGANTYGHIQKMMVALNALGIKKEWVEIILYQFVRLKSGEKIEKMSKRLGTYVTARQVLDEVSKDVFRFMMLSKTPEAHLDFDLKLAKEQSEKNPVYYIQYAHARISSIIRRAKKINQNPKTSLLIHPAEISLIKQLIKFPDILSDIASNYQVHRLPLYALETATSFHNFYEKCKVIDEKNLDLSSARLALCSATQIILGNILEVLGINAPSRM